MCRAASRRIREGSTEGLSSRWPGVPQPVRKRARGIEPPFLAWEASVLTIGQRPRGGDSLSAPHAAADTLWRVRMRVFWPVTIAAAALVGLLAYGIAAKGTNTTLDEALAKGERPAAPVKA